jgi:hypothetical protein
MSDAGRACRGTHDPRTRRADLGAVALPECVPMWPTHFR